MTMTAEGATSPKSSKNPLLKSLLPVFSLIIVMTLLALGLYFIQKAQQENELDQTHSGAVHKGEYSPDFELQLLNGESKKISSFKAELYVLNFWASWCMPCLVEMPSLIALQSSAEEKGIKVFLVNVEENPEEMVPPVMQKLDLDYPIMIDPKAVLGNLFSISALPLTVVLDRHGKLLARVEGENDWNSIKIQNWLYGFTTLATSATGSHWPQR